MVQMRIERGLLDLGNETDSESQPDDAESFETNPESTLLRVKKLWRTPSVYLFLPAMFVLSTQQGAIISPALNIFLELICRAHYAAEDIINNDLVINCQSAIVHSKVARFNMWLGFIQSSLAAIVSPRLGSLSDRIGRKPILLLFLASQAVSSIVIIIAAESHSVDAYKWLFVSSIVDGLTGSIQTILLISHAYTADCTNAANRARGFGLIRACFFAGITIGPAIGGFVIERTSKILLIFYVNLVVLAGIVLYIFVILPESLPAHRRHEVRQEVLPSLTDRAGPPLSFKQNLSKFNFFKPLRVLWPSDGTRFIIKKNIVLLAGVDAIIMGVAMGTALTVLLYAEFKFGWTTVQTGYFISFASIFRVLSMLVVLPGVTWLYKRRQGHVHSEVGPADSELFLIRFGLLLEMSTYVSLGFAWNGILFAFGGVFGSIGSVASPALESALTKHVPKESTGAILGAASLLQSLMTIVAPLIFSNIYSLTVGSFPEAIFIALFAIMTIAFLATLFIRGNIHGSLYDPDDDQLNSDEPNQSHYRDDPGDEVVELLSED
ncbi:major facilitator superfamily domain-containing protein [Lipomyces japonicus]|uniref:major facilitator superfamily domain-containing protein n=1 Tax=Lipomyces japonicus TaxID=56871 RepID=UPI0034CFAC37